MRVFSDKRLWAAQVSGSAHVAQQRIRSIAMVESVEIVGFVILLTCMHDSLCYLKFECDLNPYHEVRTGVSS